MNATNDSSLAPLSLPMLAESPPAQVRILLGHTEITNTQALLDGAPVALHEKLTDPIQVEVNGQVVAWGEAVVLDGKIAIRVTQLGDDFTSVDREAS